MSPKIISVNTSLKKGERKIPRAQVRLEPGGIVGDAHFGSKNLKEVSILDWSSVAKLVAKSGTATTLAMKISPGDFAENITTENLDIKNASVGDTIVIYEKGSGNDKSAPSEKPGILLKITAIGKECHNSCPIRDALGECAMPREGIFASVVKGGEIRPGCEIELIKNETAQT